MLDSVLAVLDPLTSPRTQHLLLMKSSSHYLDRMAASLLSPQLLANKAQSEVKKGFCVANLLIDTGRLNWRLLVGRRQLLQQ